MGTLDENGVYIYDNTDQLTPFSTLLNLGQTATSNALKLSRESMIQDYSIFKSVANATAQNNYLNQMIADGFPPSPSNPLYVIREDTGNIMRHDGTGWLARYTADNNYRTITGSSEVTIDYNAWPSKPGPNRIRDTGNVPYGVTFLAKPYVEVTGAIFTTGHVVSATAVDIGTSGFKIRVAAPPGTPVEQRWFTWSATGRT